VAQSRPAHMVPAKVVVLDRFPTLANGKIDRNALPAPEVRSGEPREQSRTEVDGCAAIICAMVRDILAVPHARTTDNFFDLGGHSVHATRLAGQIREEFEIRLPIRTVLRSATLGELAAAVESLRAADA
jgi:acyl carrier protein